MGCWSKRLKTIVTRAASGWTQDFSILPGIPFLLLLEGEGLAGTVCVSSVCSQPSQPQYWIPAGHKQCYDTGVEPGFVVGECFDLVPFHYIVYAEDDVGQHEGGAKLNILVLTTVCRCLAGVRNRERWSESPTGGREGLCLLRKC